MVGVPADAAGEARCGTQSDGYSVTGRSRNGAGVSHVDISVPDILGAMSRTATPGDLLPLPPAVFHILVSLAEGDRHGYAIIQDVAERSDGSVKLGPGTLYRSIQRML